MNFRDQVEAALRGATCHPCASPGRYSTLWNNPRNQRTFSVAHHVATMREANGIMAAAGLPVLFPH